MDLLLVAPEFRKRFENAGLISSAAVLRHFGSPSATRKQVVVQATTLRFRDGPDENVFFKRYEFDGPSWRFVGRASKARREFENYEVFRRLGIRCADPIAVGEQRDGLGRLRVAWILTRAVPDALTLTEFVQKHAPVRSSKEPRALRSALVDQLAEMTRRIHHAGFFHNDLVWRNVLVTWPGIGEPKLWWIDCPRGRFARFFRERLAIKDLALLDKLASVHCTRTERLRFVRSYLGKTGLDAEVGRWAKAVLNYSGQRWA